jgi:beta propeller repeat protein
VWSEWLETEDIDGIVEVVVVRDLKTGRTSTLTTSTGLEGVWSGRAAIDKDLVAWVEDGSIRMLDLSNRRTRTLRRNFEIDRLDVDDGRVVWSEGIDGDAPREIYLHDFSANETTLVVVSRGSEDNRSPALDGTHLVYLCDSKSDALGQQVYVRDLDTGQTRRISRRSPGEYATPRISGHRVIWRDYTDRPAIHLYNLRTNTERTVPTGAPDPQDPDIDGDIVVWCDARTGVSDVYGYDLVRERTYRVSRNKTYGAAMPRISGKRVVWWSPPDYGERVHWGKIDRKRVVGAK